MVNQKILKWTNPTTRKGVTDAYGAQDNAGYAVSFDGGDLVSVPIKWGTEFDLSTLAQYKQLPAGEHTVVLHTVDTDGQVSDPGPAATFKIAHPPGAVANVSIA
jgi:hypothetical protein